MSQLLSDATFKSDIGDCRRLLRGGSRTFHLASLLLPRDVREASSALYAFCRVADDLIDEAETPEEAAEALQLLRVRLRRAYAGLPDASPIDRALANVVHRYAIPITIPEALLEGFEWDSERRRYDTLSDVVGYGVRVAGTVGIMMSMLMGATNPLVLARACDLGVAMQLSNIARDVGEDARAGRLYLPRDWLLEVGIDPDAWLASPQFTPELASVVQRLLTVAEELYELAAPGVSALPFACRPGIEAARLLYGEIGREVGRNGHDSISRRAVVSVERKITLVSLCLFNVVSYRRLPNNPALPEAAFLVDSVAFDVGSRPKRIGEALDAKLGFVFDLFERLGERDRLRRIGT